MFQFAFKWTTHKTTFRLLFERPCCTIWIQNYACRKGGIAICIHYRSIEMVIFTALPPKYQNNHKNWMTCYKCPTVKPLQPDPTKISMARSGSCSQNYYCSFTKKFQTKYNLCQWNEFAFAFVNILNSVPNSTLFGVRQNKFSDE